MCPPVTVTGTLALELATDAIVAVVKFVALKTAAPQTSTPVLKL